MSFNSNEDEQTIEKKYDIKSREGNWMKFKEGDNKIRLVSDCVDFGNHFDTQLKKSFICTGKETCKYCQAGDKSRVQFYAWIIDREDGEIKLTQFGYSIYKAIEKLAKSEDYAFEKVPNYDINVTRKGKGLDTEYSILADRKDTKLTKEEEKLIEDTCKPLDEMIEKMKSKLSGDTEINVKEVIKREPVKETEEKIKLAKN